jgi:negative regulator of sigma-B (phosphoserine phosphatase)
MEDLMEMLPEWGLARMLYPGETESGDWYVVTPFANGVLVAVVDGLGHGRDAAIATRLATVTLEQHAHEPPEHLFLRCNEVLRPTRGAAISMASFDRHCKTMTWLAVGNVSGTLVRADPADGARMENLVLRGGVVGLNLPELRPAVIPVASGDTLVFATDGVRLVFTELLPSHTGPPQQLADRILQSYATHADDALVLVFPCHNAMGLT